MADINDDLKHADLVDKLKFSEAVMIALYHATDDIALKSRDKKLKNFGLIVKNYAAKSLATIRDIPIEQIEEDLHKELENLINSGDSVTTVYNETSLHLN